MNPYLCAVAIFLLSAVLFHLEDRPHWRNATVIAAQFMFFVMAVKDIVT